MTNPYLPPFDPIPGAEYLDPDQCQWVPLGGNPQRFTAGNPNTQGCGFTHMNWARITSIVSSGDSWVITAENVGGYNITETVLKNGAQTFGMKTSDGGEINNPCGGTPDPGCQEITGGYGYLQFSHNQIYWQNVNDALIQATKIISHRVEYKPDFPTRKWWSIVTYADNLGNITTAETLHNTEEFANCITYRLDLHSGECVGDDPTDLIVGCRKLKPGIWGVIVRNNCPILPESTDPDYRSYCGLPGTYTKIGIGSGAQATEIVDVQETKKNVNGPEISSFDIIWKDRDGVTQENLDLYALEGTTFSLFVNPGMEEADYCGDDDPRPNDCVDLPYNVTWDKANCPKLEVPIGAKVCQPIIPKPPDPPEFCITGVEGCQKTKTGWLTQLQWKIDIPGTKFDKDNGGILETGVWTPVGNYQFLDAALNEKVVSIDSIKSTQSQFDLKWRQRLLVTYEDGSGAVVDTWRTRAEKYAVDALKWRIALLDVDENKCEIECEPCYIEGCRKVSGGTAILQYNLYNEDLGERVWASALMGVNPDAEHCVEILDTRFYGTGNPTYFAHATVLVRPYLGAELQQVGMSIQGGSGDEERIRNIKWRLFIPPGASANGVTCEVENCDPLPEPCSIEGCRKVNGSGVLERNSGAGDGWITAFPPPHSFYGEGQTAVEITEVRRGKSDSGQYPWYLVVVFKITGGSEVAQSFNFYSQEQRDNYKFRIVPDTASGSTCEIFNCDPIPEPRPTPLPCPVDPSDYQWVRYVGNVTSSDMSRMNMNSSNSNDVWTGNQITTRWYRCPNATYPDSFVSLGGMWVKYPPAVAYTWGVADKAFDPADEDYIGEMDAAIGANYEKMIVPATGKMPPWRAKYRVDVGPGITYGSLGFYQPHIGAIGGDLVVADPVYPLTWSVTIDNSDTLEVFQGWYQIDGWWEFSNDKEQVLGSWSGQDFNGLDRDCDDVECQERQTYGVLQYWDPNDNHWIDAWSNSQPKANLARKITGVTSGGQDLSYNYLSTATFITIPYLGDDPANEYSSNADWSGSEEDAQQVRWRIIPRGDTPNNPCLDDSEIE